MATEVITRKLCDVHGINGEKVEASEVIQFAHEGVVLEVDACPECWKKHEQTYGPLVDVSRVVKRRRKSRKDAVEPDGEQQEEPA